MADIPGLVEGAAGGKGLGDRFLRHIERARVLVVLIDLDPLAVHQPAEQLRILLGELGGYQPELLERPRIVVGSKHDLSGTGGHRGPSRRATGARAGPRASRRRPAAGCAR